MSIKNKSELASLVVDRLLSGPLGQQIAAEQAAATLAERSAAAANLASILAEREQSLPDVAKANAEAEARVKAAEQALAEATAALGAAANRWRDVETTLATRERVQRAALEDLAPTSIATFVEDLHRLRWPSGEGFARLVEARCVPEPVVTMSGEKKVGVSAEQRARVSAAVDRKINQAREAARALAYQPLSDEEIDARVAELRAEFGGCE